MNLQISCTHILRYWAGTLDHPREIDRRCRRMRIGALQRVRSRNDGERFLLPGYACVQSAEWPRRYHDTVLWWFVSKRLFVRLHA